MNGGLTMQQPRQALRQSGRQWDSSVDPSARSWVLLPLHYLLGQADVLKHRIQARRDQQQAFLIAREKAFVRVLERLDAPHLELLRRFMLSSNENGLGDGSAGSESDKPMSALNDEQIDLVLPDWDAVLPTLISSLVSQGLISTLPGGGGYAGGGRNRTHKITDFGCAVLDRLTVVSHSTRM